MHPDATSAGVDVLRSGGNAVDAAIAVAAAISVTNHHWAGLAGDSAWLIHWVDSSETLHLDGYSICPSSMTANALVERLGLGPDRTAAALREEPSGLRDSGMVVAMVPGTPAALHAAWLRFGSIPMSALLERAISLAKSGVPVSRYLAQSLHACREKLGGFEASRSVFFRDGKTPLIEGDTIFQCHLAETLERFARDPAREFSHGETARAIVRRAKEQAALLTADDLAAYEPKWRTPLRGSYRGNSIAVTAPPTAGLHVLQALSILEHFDLTNLGYHTVRSLHLMIEAVKLALADRRRYGGDPDQGALPVEKLLSSAHASDQAARIRPHMSLPRLENASARGNETTHFVVMDRQGNVVSATQTIGSDYGCGAVVEGTGLVLNDRTWWMSLGEGPNQVAPGRRSNIGHAPAIVLGRDGAWLALGSPGGFGIVSYVVQVLVSVIDHGFDLQDAIEAPRFRVNDLEHAVGCESRFGEGTLEALSALGHRLEVYPAWTDRVGGVEGIQRHAVSGCLLGGYDPRRNSWAAGL